MYGHLDMIYQFYYQTDKPYGIFCEDDIYIHKDFKKSLDTIEKDLKKLQLDMLLIGYLVINNTGNNQKLINVDTELKYYTYNDELWGAQMYLLSRSYAKTLLDKYSNDYLERRLIDNNMKPFSADWTITKDTKNRALLYPLIVVENGKKTYTHYGQQMFHYHSFYNKHLMS